MKKMLAIAPYPYLPFFSGGQKFIAQFFEWLGKETDLTVITVAENDLSLATTYKTIPLLKRSFARYIDRSLVKKITALVKKENFDTLICEHPYFAWLAFAIRKRTGIKVIIHTHNIEYQRFRSFGKWWWPVLKSYEKRSFKKADAIFFITPEDRRFAISAWHIPAEKCIDLPFGITIKDYPHDRDSSRRIVAEKYGITGEEKILLFSGLLNYKPNIDALKVILEKINPLFLADPSFQYKIIICGKHLPVEFNELKDHAGKNIIYAGFIDAIDVYYKATDILLNPVQSGGGIKTKMVEAIAYGAAVVSSGSGATGMAQEVCGDKLSIIPDDHWEEFAKYVINHTGPPSLTPAGYYDYYYWPNIISRILQY